ncbi:uncharacterized protein A4U43_C06F1310 [Asparagus officinalis]|uniref:VQ domain-containing protein n=1 Tax=Asparagus officinalis TaxID=4686 RepID=A0A5P1EP62_ASPOF|nr:uncharacterized protein LOC109844719 [Asparagus officinalis]ONK65820.1 uncharacterized protein A4U43_C06F1310 [Asparagus officinalis]
MTSPNDWAQIGPILPSKPPTPTSSTRPASSQPTNNVEGRVGKSARSGPGLESTPTTMLNTDPTNFRAMVQQFTGAPVGPYASPSRPVISFGLGEGVQVQQQHPGQLVCSRGQFGQFDEAVTLPGGTVNDGFSISSAAASNNGFFLEGMMGGNSRSGGYFL